MKCDEIFAALDLLEKERGISPTFMMDKIIQALTTAYKKDHEGVENVIVDVDEVRKDLRMYVQKEIVEEVENPGSQMSLEEARAKFGRVVDLGGSEDELLEELRIQGYAGFQSIKFALLETNGQLSVLPYAADKPATAAQVGAAVQETGLPVVIISDGRLLEHNLRGAGYEHGWLEKQLAAHGLHSHRQAFLLTVDEGGNTCCVPKREAKP